VPLRSGLVAVGQIAPNANVRFGSLPLIGILLGIALAVLTVVLAQWFPVIVR
jgi:hypothetical protein